MDALKGLGYILYKQIIIYLLLVIIIKKKYILRIHLQTFEMYQRKLQKTKFKKNRRILYGFKKNNWINTKQKKNILLYVKSCFWMASTLSYFESINNFWSIYTQCPKCENKIDKFPIPFDLN